MIDKNLLGRYEGRDRFTDAEVYATLELVRGDGDNSIYKYSFGMVGFEPDNISEITGDAQIKMMLTNLRGNGYEKTDDADAPQSERKNKSMTGFHAWLDGKDI